MGSTYTSEQELDQLGMDRMDDESLSIVSDDGKHHDIGLMESTHMRVAAATDKTANAMQMQRIPINAHDAPEAFVVVAPLPAVSPKDVTVELHDGLLRIFARLRSSGPREYVLHEWEYGGYEREIELPPDFGSGLEATLTNGQLVVRVLRGACTQRISMQPHQI